MGYKKTLTLALSAALAVAGWMTAHNALAQTFGNQLIDGESISLKQLLERELRARRDSEFAFIQKVVDLVDAETLPRSIVDSTLLWARKRPRHKFQYFERALKIRAEKIGVDL